MKLTPPRIDPVTRTLIAKLEARGVTLRVDAKGAVLVKPWRLVLASEREYLRTHREEVAAIAAGRPLPNASRQGSEGAESTNGLGSRPPKEAGPNAGKHSSVGARWGGQQRGHRYVVIDRRHESMSGARLRIERLLFARRFSSAIDNQTPSAIDRAFPTLTRE